MFGLVVRGRCRSDVSRVIGGFLKHDVRVGPGEPERTDTRNAGPPVWLPGGGLLDNLHRELIPRNVRRRIAKVQVLRQ
jgi:hypothetical protein